MKKAVFLDRDGVLNKEIGNYVTNTADFELLPGVAATLLTLQQKGYLLIVITNQGGIAKGMYSHETLHAIHRKLTSTLSRSGVALDAIYYCPHHPDFSGKCICRKPESGMLEKAMARFNINPKQSYFIGDHDRDMQAGGQAGLNTIRIASNSPLHPVLNMIV